MVVAKHDALTRSCRGSFTIVKWRREYLTLVWGVVQAGRRIDAPIGRDPINRKKMSARVRRSREAVTRIVRASISDPASRSRRSRFIPGGPIRFAFI